MHRFTQADISCAELALLTCLFLFNTAAAAAPEVLPQQTSVSVVRDGDVFRIEAQSRIAASRDIAWSVLTDYDGYTEFVPGMTLSRHLSEQPLRIEQRGVFGILFLRKRVYSTLDVQEDPPFDIRFRALQGNLRRLETEVRIAQDGDNILIIYRSMIEPDFWVPPLIGTSIVRAGIRAKLGAVAEEIERRAMQEAPR